MKGNFPLDSRIYPLFFVLFIFESISGIYFYLSGSFTIYRQYAILAHIILGFLLLLPALTHQILHIIRSFNSARRLTKNFGYIGFACTAISLITGVIWSLDGTRADNYLITNVHLVSSIIALAAVVVHITLFIVSRKIWKLFYIFLPKSNVAFGVVMAGIILFASSTYKPVEFKNGTPAGYVFKWNDNPFYPSETSTSTGGIIDSGVMANSRSCGLAGCHTDIYNQWYSSAHRWSSTGVFYRKAEEYIVQTDGKVASRYCGGCHDPIALLAGDFNPGKGFDTPHDEEGISCIACHAITKIKHLRGSGSYLITPPERYIYEGKEGKITEFLSGLVIGSDPEQHKKTYSKDFYKKPEYCAVCHKQFVTKDTNNWGWMKLQDQYGSWLASRFSGRNSKGFFSEKDLKTCNDCHMPLVKSDDPAAGSDGMVRSHRFIAANTANPYLSGDKEQLDLTTEWMKRREIYLDIYETRVKNAVRGERFVSQDIYHNAEVAPYVYMGDTVELKVALTNIGVGHHFPDGPIDIHEAWVEVKITDGQGNVIFWSGNMDENGFVDEKAHFYRALGVDREGQLINKHNIWQMVGNIYSKTIPPGETDIATYEFQIPYWIKGDMTIMARLRYKKFNQWYTNWALSRTDIRLPVVDMARDSMTLPVRKKREQEKVASVNGIK